MADLTVKQKQIFDNYKKTHQKISDADILSALVNLRQIQLSEEQKLSLFNNSTNNDSGMGLKLEHTQKSANPTNQPQETVFLQSGRKIVITKSQDGKDLYKYYSADGTRLNPDYFKQQEGVVRVSANRKTYTVTKNGNTTVKKAKNPLMAKIDQQQAELNKTKKQQGFLGKSWDWFKNTTGIGDGSNKAQKQLDAERKLVQQIQNGKISKKDFKDVTGLDYSQENLQKFKNGEIELKSSEKIKGYQEGQEMACDVAGDLVSGIAAVGIHSLAVAAVPFTGGASIAVGVGAAALSGAVIKAGIKALDATTGGRKYSRKDLEHDIATGAFSGLLAPITGGMGGAVGKTVATKLGVQAVKSVGKEVAETVVETGVKHGVKEGIKTALVNPTGYEYIGGTLVKRAAAMSAEMATDGALGGAIDGGFRAGLDNDWDANAIISGTVEGGVGGALMAPIIGGGFKAVGKGGHKLGEKIKGGKEASDAVEGAIGKEITDGTEGTSRTKTNDITSNTKSEKVISDRTSGKKTYQKPKTEVKSFVAEDDLLADTTKPKTKAKPKAVDEPRMVLRENKPVTVEQARNMLLDLGFPIEEVNNFTFDNNSLMNINYIYFMLKEKMVPDFADIDFSSSADNVIEARKDIFGFLKAETGFEYKFINKENIAEYNKYISINNFDELSDVINILENDLFKEHIDDLMKIIPIITKNGKEKLTVQEYKELRGINEDAFKFITPERSEFVRKINSNVPEEYKIGLNSYEDLGASETLTEEFAKQYVNEVNRFIKHGVNDGTSLYQNGLKNKMREMKEISDFLDKYPLELRVDKKGLIASRDVKELMTRPDIEKIQKLLHEMTPEARQNISVDRLPEPDSDIPFDKWRDFFNFISNGSFSKEHNAHEGIASYKFVDFVRKQNIKDFDSFMEYMELLRGTYAYTWEHQFNEFFVISNNDYKNAASMLREMKNICDSISSNTFDDHFVTYQLRNIIGNQDIDFKEVTKRLKYLQEKNVKFKEGELYTIALSKHPDTAKLAEILYESGFGVNGYSSDYIFNKMDMTPAKLQKMMDDFIIELGKSCDLDDSFDINLIKEAALSKDADAIFYGIMRGDKCPDYAVSRAESVLRKNNKAFYDKYWNKPNSPFKSNELFELGSNINDKNIELALKICDDEEFIKDFRFVRDILIATAKYNNKRLSESLLFDKSLNFEKSQIIDILGATNADNLYLATKLCTESQLKFPKEHIAGILSQTSWINSNLAEKLCFDKEFPKDLIKDIIRELNNYSKRDILDFADWICFDKDVNFPREKIADFLSVVNNVNKDFAKRLLTDKSINIPQEIIANILRVTNAQNLEEATRLCLNYRRLEIEPNQIPMLLRDSNKLSLHQVRKVNKVFGREAVAKMSDGDFKIAAQFIDIKDVTNINEIPAHAKKDFLKALVACNEGLFNISDDLKKMFPMIPTNRDDYCSLLPAIVRSLGIETNILKPEQVIKFNKSMEHLSESLAKISDTDFANLHITQEYSRNEFIQTTLQKLKGLSDNERQKVFDYFGFELHTYSVKTDKLDPKGKPIYEKHYTITGYPVNLNNGHKLAQITNPETKSVVENLRPDVIRFSKNNRIKCENPQVETLLNELAEALPELHSIVGRVQHGSHQYDVLQHSLKVMQKISQDSNFKKLSDSDKKIMLLASIMHDITKKEGTTDVMHAINGSFDTFFIAKKFNLTKEEEIKLYTLIKHHEWLSYANSSSVQSEEVLTKRLQSIAYDLRHDNMFDLALMFTHADLKAVKTDDAFHDSKIGKSRINFNGEVHSFGESADIFAKRIREYITELKKSQPILPVTKMPRASRMKQAITHVNPDGSTNIKGVYQDKDGLLIVRFNEVEDWEALGLPKGSISKGIKTGDDVDTGNIHFFVHGLDYVNQLVKFDAFGMIDSEVLLSMSYAERPESKFRFFRPQGVLLDVPTKYVHGGGNTDAGSGCGKFVSEFKKNYIFGGHRESDRLYISNLVKEATGMSDDEYVKFVEKYENKPFTDIYPEDIRNKIIKIFAEINSRVRKNGERSYNEMYGSNPSDVMGVFGYPTDVEGKIGDNIFDFVKSNGNLDGFLRQYALERDIPMYILGY